MAKDFTEKEDADLFRKIKSDDFMYTAIIESYQTLRVVLIAYLEDEEEKE